MKRMFISLIVAGVLIWGVGNSVWALNLENVGWSDDVIVYETPVTYSYVNSEGQEDTINGLDYVVENRSNDYVWGLIVGLSDLYMMSYPVPQENVFDPTDNWWGWDYWDSVVVSKDNLSDFVADVYFSAFDGDLTEEEYDQIRNFIGNSITPSFNDYNYVYFTYQAVANDFLNEDDIEDNPIKPKSTAGGFGVLTTGICIPASPVVYVSTSTNNPDKTSGWKFGLNQTKEPSALVPEPSTCLLVLLGLVGGTTIRRKR